MMKRKRFFAILVICLIAGVSCASDSPLKDEPSSEANEPSPTTLVSPSPATTSDCSSTDGEINNVIVNGGFEESDDGWTLRSSGTGATWREHSLIGTGAPFSPYSGDGAARLGGYEGSSDLLSQPITIPTNGLLSYWWRISQPRPVSQLTVSLASLDGSSAEVLAVHRDEDSAEGWQQDCFDLSSHSGEAYILEFHVYNDNYTMTAFDIDKVVLGR